MRSIRAASAALAASLTVALTVSLSGAVAPSYADPARPGLPALPEQASDRAEQVLDLVEDVLAGKDRGVEHSTAFRELFKVRDQLEGEDRERAERIMARPDGQTPSGDPDANWDHSWNVSQEARPLCNAQVCVHYVTSGPHAATYAQAKATLDTMARAWKREIGAMKFRAPRKDGTRGDRRWANSKGKIDVYLAELSTMGAFGYAMPESEPRRTDDGKSWTTTGYMVLDQDYAEYGCPSPANCRRVTAAHELFHLIQYAYDVTEEVWFMESTATWMEERVFTGINDNRNYLRFGQLAKPGDPLELTNQGAEYGNWIFHEHYGQKHGHHRVRRAWTLAGRAGWDWRRGLAGSLKAVGTTLPDAYVAFAAGNQFPARTYAEGSAYSAAPAHTVVKNFGRTGLLAPGTTHTFNPAVNPLASASVRYWPDAGLPDTARLRVDFSLDRRLNRAHVVVAWQDGRVTHHKVTTDSSGIGSRNLLFDPRRIRSVTVTQANLTSDTQRLTARASVRQ